MNDNDKFRKFFGFGSQEEAAVDQKEAKTEDNVADNVDATAHNDATTHNNVDAVAEWTEKYLSLAADFQNYQKRVSHERSEWAFDAQKVVCLQLLDVIDNFERALDVERKRESAEGVAWLAGFEMIYQSLEKILHKCGVSEITDFTVFNPKYHEALLQVESSDKESGQVVQVLKKGYMMHDKVIRPATVSVAK